MVLLSPVGLAAAPVANSLSTLVTFKEKLCNCVCSTSTNQPEATVSYKYDTPILNVSTVFVPVIATITIVTPNCGCKAAPQVITEKFMAAFQGQTGLPTAVTITSLGTTQGLIKIVCGKSNTYAVNDSITVVINPASAAADAPST